MDHHFIHADFCLPPEFLNDHDDMFSNFSTGKPNSGHLTNVNPGFYATNSPQSTLCGCKHGGSSRGSPNCPSPPATAPETNRSQTSTNILHAAAGEVARMRMLEEAASRYCKISSASDLRYQQLQVAKFQQLKQEQIAKQLQYLQIMLQNKTRHQSGNDRPVAWPATVQRPHQQRSPAAGMRAVFLGNNISTKRESTGTGVFLPRQTGTPIEQTKRGCSTVLLPERVVQALNLNVEAETKLQSRCNGGDAEIMYPRNLMMSQQSRNNHRQQAPAMPELRLPQEWTY